MPTLMDSTAVRTKPASWIAVGFAVVLGLAIVGIPNLMRSRMGANESWRFAREHGLGGTPASNSVMASLRKPFQQARVCPPH